MKLNLTGSKSNTGLTCITEINRKRLAIIGGNYGQPKSSLVKSHGVFVAHRGDLILLKDFINGKVFYGKVINPKSITKECFILCSDKISNYKILDKDSNLSKLVSRINKKLDFRFNVVNLINLSSDGKYYFVESSNEIPSIEIELVNIDDNFSRMESALDDYMYNVNKIVGLGNVPNGCFLMNYTIFESKE